MILLSGTTFASAAFADSYSISGIAVVVNGERLYTDTDPVIRNNRTLVPVRGIFEKMGASVSWIPGQRKAEVNYKGKVISLKIDNSVVSIDGSDIRMDVAPIIYNNRTMIPLRFISESIGMNVRWAPETKIAFVSDPSYSGKLPDKTILGFTTNDYKGDTGSYNSLVNHHDTVNSIATFSYQLNDEGNLSLTGESQLAAVSYANSNNIKPLVLVHNYVNGQFNRDIAHAVLSNEGKRGNLINGILDVINRQGYAGVNIDIENVYWYDRQLYTDFVKEVKNALSSQGYITTLSIPAKTADYFANNNWGGAFDYSELGKYADQVLIMTYDEHYFEGAAGPVASLSWVDSVMQYATQTIPANKILLGIAGYGYDWSGTGTRALTFSGIEKLISGQGIQPSWDESSQTPYFIYYQDGIRHEVWYENAKSISIKLDLISKYRLGGIGIWRLGYDNNNFWNAIKDKLE